MNETSSPPSPIAYTIRTAALATGRSESTIRRAINAGDLATANPRINGRPVKGASIAPEELRRWALNLPDA